MMDADLAQAFADAAIAFGHPRCGLTTCGRLATHEALMYGPMCEACVVAEPGMKFVSMAELRAARNRADSSYLVAELPTAAAIRRVEKRAGIG